MNDAKHIGLDVHQATTRLARCSLTLGWVSHPTADRRRLKDGTSTSIRSSPLTISSTVLNLPFAPARRVSLSFVETPRVEEPVAMVCVSGDRV